VFVLQDTGKIHYSTREGTALLKLWFFWFKTVWTSCLA